MEYKVNKHCERSRTTNLLILESDDECDNYGVNLSEFQAICDTESSVLKKELLLSDSVDNFDAIACNLPMIDALLDSKSQTNIPVCTLEVYEDVNFNILTIDADLFSWETPLETTFMEFKHLSCMEDDLFTYDLLMSYTEDELLLLWPIIESKGLVWTTIEEKDGKFQIEYMNSTNAMTKSSNQSYDVQPMQPSYMPYSEQYWGFDKSNLVDERFYAESEILFHKKLIRLMDIFLEEWLELKYEDPEFDPMDEVKRIVTSWLTRSFKDQFNEFMEIKRKMIGNASFDLHYDPNDVDFSDWLASKFHNHKTMDRATKDVLWVYWMRGEDEEVVSDKESCYPSFGNNKRVRLESRKVSPNGSFSWNESFSSDCKVVLELRWRRNTSSVFRGSKLLGRAEVSWRGVFESPNMEMERWLMMITKNKDVNAPYVRIVMKIETPNGVAFVERKKKNKWDESCGCSHGDFCNSACLDSELFVIGAALDAF
ncbi:C2 calcium/lipid-binding domain, CaLB [Artemisia annua]|uniref:C2 calcium/lipid-binding domain, CaLB n=1 Tax=Artemisia annua TaxID=35608 RepID=A0A2U1PHW5_ARTAN|nr:C2 calcium/lipid-binding domain, CaLB [Artemisia annua]